MSSVERVQSLSILLLVIVGFTLVTATLTVRAEGLSQAELFFELNDTDGDLGLHAAIDGEEYTRLEIESPNGRKIFSVKASGPLAQQGLTQLFLESAEPSFDELAPEEFFKRFPEGNYRIRATTSDKNRFEATVALSQVMAAPPANILISGIPAAKNCDAAALPAVREPVIIDWDAVTTSHPRLGKSGEVRIVKYQLFVEREGVKFSVDLPSTVTEFQVPSSIIALGDNFKFEIIARTASGNNTAVESCFTVLK